MPKWGVDIVCVALTFSSGASPASHRRMRLAVGRGNCTFPPWWQRVRLVHPQPASSSVSESGTCVGLSLLKMVGRKVGGDYLSGVST